MKRPSFFDRMSAKTVGSLLCAHLQGHYRLSPAAAGGLAADLLRYAQLLDQPGRRDGQIIYHGVALDQPPGKPLLACCKVPVRLTLFGADDLDWFRQLGRPAFTGRVMARLAREAVDQGAALSVEDEAWLLRISPRTVKRYRRQLARDGVELPLRGDLTDAGPSMTHRDPIVKLFLLGYSESEIALRCQHRIECVESYIYDFLRVGLLAQEAKAPGTICRVVKLSLSKVQAIVHLYHRLRDDPDYAEPLRHWLEIFALDRDVKKGGRRP
jgi:DNA-binding CsgD family transcriptional regulator